MVYRDQVRTSLTFCALVAILASGSPAPAAADLGTEPGERGASGSVRQRRHEVAAGECLSAIASRYDVSVEQLLEWNSLDDPDHVRQGQSLVVGSGPRPVQRPRERPAHEGPVYTVRRGDSLRRIARREDTTLAVLTRLNPHVDPERIRVGEELNLPIPDGRHRIDYRVRTGDTLQHLATRHRVTIREIRRWNGTLRRRSRLRNGETVRIWSIVPESTSASVGSPNSGSLAHAERLPPHPGYVIRDNARAFGTLETILWIQDAFDAVRERHERFPRLELHDISRRRGGFLRGHRSHQSGRDLDVAVYQNRCRNNVCGFHRVSPANLDAARTYSLFEHWLRRGRVEAIFLDYSLQRPLYEEARRRGATREQLTRWFQYPRGRESSGGIIRHYPRHRDHAHVRFVCHDTDEECRAVRYSARRRQRSAMSAMSPARMRRASRMSRRTRRPRSSMSSRALTMSGMGDTGR